MQRFGIALLFGLAGYVVAAFAGGYLVYLFSGNPHDRELEAAMTGAFVLGPAGGLIALVIGLIRGNKRR